MRNAQHARLIGPRGVQSLSTFSMTVTCCGCQRFAPISDNLCVSARYLARVLMIAIMSEFNSTWFLPIDKMPAQVQM